jgi:hypothetical protein
MSSRPAWVIKRDPISTPKPKLKTPKIVIHFIVLKMWKVSEKQKEKNFLNDPKCNRSMIIILWHTFMSFSYACDKHLYFFPFT